MKSFWTKAVVSAAAILCAGAANAAVTNIDFESADTSGAPFAPLLTDQDYVTQSGYFVGAYDPNNSGPPNQTAFVGALMNGADSSTCLDNNCPAGNSTNYLASLNDGFIFIGALDGSALVLHSFEAAFIGPFAGLPDSTVAFLAIEADRTDGSYALGYVPLLGPSGGTTSFTTFNPADATLFGGTGTLTSGHVDRLFAYAYYCGTGGSCSAATSNKGQFALDNIMLGVPEPGNWLLMTLGLGALGAAARRRRSL